MKRVSAHDGENGGIRVVGRRGIALAGLVVLLAGHPSGADEPVRPLGSRIPIVRRSNHPLSVQDIADPLPQHAIRRLNESLSVEDLVEQVDQEPTIVTPMPAPGESIPVPIDHYPHEVAPEEQIPRQVFYTRMPDINDGLAGNRQVALTPFPNLDIQSGPLATHQLPWYHKTLDRSPHWILKTTSYQGLLGFKRSLGINDDTFGWYNSVHTGLPFWKERDVGVQLGVVIEPTTLEEMLFGFTAGFFHQAMWCHDHPTRLLTTERLSWGIVYDIFHDSDEGTGVGQFRGKVAYALAPNRELGVWGTFPAQEDDGTLRGRPVVLEPSHQVAVYHRMTFPSEVDVTVLLGVAESPGAIYGGGYLSYRFSDLGSIVLWGQKNADDQAYAIYGGVRIDCYPRGDTSLLSGNPQNRYQPFLEIVDHVNLQVRKRLP